MTTDLKLPAPDPGLRPAPASRAERAVQKARVGYILTASHSGSTLLAMLLGAHPEACTVGELKGIEVEVETYRCSCGELIRECDFWRRVNSAMRQRGFDFEITSAGTNIHKGAPPYLRRLLNPLHRGPVLEWMRDTALCSSPGWRAHLDRVQRRNAALAAALLEESGTQIIIDSSKVGLRLKYLLRNPDLDVRVLRLVRDGRAVSMTHTSPAEFADAADPRHRSGGSGAVRPNFRLPMDEAALLWRHSNEEADRVTASLPRAQWMEVRYEELCRRPKETLRAVCDFLGLAPVPVGGDFRARKPQHIVGNGMRFDRSSDIRLDERWRTHLSAENLQIFERLAGALNRKYGYE